MLNPCKNHFESFQNTAFSMANLDVTLLHSFRPGGWGPTVRRFKEVALPGTLPTFRGWWCYKKRKENERNIFFKRQWTNCSKWLDTDTHMSHTHIYNYIYMYIYIITVIWIIICVCVFNRDSFVDSSVQLLDDSDTQTIHRNRGLQQCSDNARGAPDLPWHFGTWALVPWDAWIHGFF